MTPPQTLDRAGIARLIPHSGRMCLLERLIAWDANAIHCSTTDHRAEDNPLRVGAVLPAPCAIEIAAQAMALHGGLIAAPGSTPSAGFLASVRSVRFSVDRLDTVPGALQLHARRLSGDASQVMYQFEVKSEAGALLAEGRAVVVLNTPLPDTSKESTA